MVPVASPIHAAVLRGIQNLCNLRTCIWTRDGTLTDDIIDALRNFCPRLRELETNGRHTTNYSPEWLAGFGMLESLTLVMPSREFVGCLVRWCEAYGSGLKEMTLVCKVRPATIAPLSTFGTHVAFLICSQRHISLTKRSAPLRRT